MRAWLLRLLAVALVVGLPPAVRPHSASACFCGTPAAEDYDVVFAGKAIALGPWGSVKVEVSRVWKGDVEATALVRFWGWGTSCEYRFQLGREYLVYADHDVEGTLMTGLCDSLDVGLHGQFVQEHLELLGEGRLPGPAGAVSDAASSPDSDTTGTPATAVPNAEQGSGSLPPPWAIALMAAGVAAVLGGAGLVGIRRLRAR